MSEWVCPSSFLKFYPAWYTIFILHCVINGSKYKRRRKPSRPAEKVSEQPDWVREPNCLLSLLRLFSWVWFFFASHHRVIAQLFFVLHIVYVSFALHCSQLNDNVHLVDTEWALLSLVPPKIIVLCIPSELRAKCNFGKYRFYHFDFLGRLYHVKLSSLFYLFVLCIH